MCSRVCFVTNTLLIRPPGETMNNFEITDAISDQAGHIRVEIKFPVVSLWRGHPADTRTH